jgi:Rrf2 family protein
LIDCARGGDRLIKVAELSQHLQITPQNVFKIVNLLARAGLIEAMRGRNGGVRLARPAAAIRIGDVVRATEVTHVEIEDGTVGRKQKAGPRCQQDPRRRARRLHRRARSAHAADMAAGQPAEPAAPRRKPAVAAKPAAIAGPRYRRALHDNG